MSLSKFNFPHFTNSFMYIVNTLTSLLLYYMVFNDPGIVCIQFLVYLFLVSSHKVLSGPLTILIIVSSTAICDIRLIYAALPYILNLQLQYLVLFGISHVFLIHYASLLFLEFGLDKVVKNFNEVWQDVNVVMMMTYPLVISLAWSFIIAQFCSLTLMPFLLTFFMFSFYQYLFYCNAEMMKNDRMDLPVVINIMQIVSAVVCHFVCVLYQLVFEYHAFSLAVFMIDHTMLWALTLLFCFLSPSIDYFVLKGYLKKDALSLVTLFMVIVCLLIVWPMAALHKVDLHTSQLMFAQLVTISTASLLVFIWPRRFILITGAALCTVTLLIWLELPWGIKLFPRTVLYLEQIYAGLIVLVLLGLFSTRYLGLLFNSRHQPTRTLHRATSFEMPFLLMVTVMHYLEYHLFSTSLASSLSLCVSSLLVVVAVAYLSRCPTYKSMSLLGSTSNPSLVVHVIDAQIAMKLALLSINYRFQNSRLLLDKYSLVFCALIGWIVSINFRQKSKSFGVQARIFTAASRMVLLCVSMVMIKETVVLPMLHEVTHESVLVVPSSWQMIVVGVLFDLLMSLANYACAQLNGTLPSPPLDDQTSHNQYDTAIKDNPRQSPYTKPFVSRAIDEPFGHVDLGLIAARLSVCALLLISVIFDGWMVIGLLTFIGILLVNLSPATFAALPDCPVLRTNRKSWINFIGGSISIICMVHSTVGLSTSGTAVLLCLSTGLCCWGDSVTTRRKAQVTVIVLWQLSLLIAMVMNPSWLPAISQAHVIIRYFLAIGPPLVQVWHLSRQSLSLPIQQDLDTPVDVSSQLLPRVYFSLLLTGALAATNLKFYHPLMWPLPMALVLFLRPPMDSRVPLGRYAFGLSAIGCILALATIQASPLLLTNSRDVSLVTSSAEIGSSDLLQLNTALYIHAYIELILVIIITCAGHINMIAMAYANSLPPASVLPWPLRHYHSLMLLHSLIVPCSLFFVFVSTSICFTAFSILSFILGMTTLVK